MELDPQATSLGGWTGSMNLNRNAGVHQVNAALWSVSPGFDSSDTGFTFASDRAGVHAVVSVSESQGHSLRARPVPCGREVVHVELCPRAPGGRVHMFGNVELRNDWTVFANVGLFRTVQDDRGTRGGPSMLQPSSHNEFIGIESDGRKRISVGGNLGSNHNDVGAWNRSLGINVRYRPAAALEISAGPNFERTHSLSRYVDAFEDPVAADTYGSRYVFSTLDQEEFSLQTRVNYVLSPKMSLQLDMQPLVSVGHYTGFKQFARPRTFDFIPLDREPGSLTYDPVNRKYTAKPADGGATFEFDDPDFNVKSLRLNLIYRWEWRPGSALYVVWTEQRQDDAYPGQFQLQRDLGGTFSAPADDVLMFKLSYWFQR